jgi:hypothetical protein
LSDFLAQLRYIATMQVQSHQRLETTKRHSAVIRDPSALNLEPPPPNYCYAVENTGDLRQVKPILLPIDFLRSRLDAATICRLEAKSPRLWVRFFIFIYLFFFEKNDIFVTLYFLDALFLFDVRGFTSFPPSDLKTTNLLYWLHNAKNVEVEGFLDFVFRRADDNDREVLFLFLFFFSFVGDIASCPPLLNQNLLCFAPFRPHSIILFQRRHRRPRSSIITQFSSHRVSHRLDSPQIATNDVSISSLVALHSLCTDSVS